MRSALGLTGALFAVGSGIAYAEPRDDYAWVVTKRATPLRLDADGSDVRWMPKGILLRIRDHASGPSLHAWCPAFTTFGTVDAAAVEDAPAPDEAALLAQRTGPILPEVVSAGELPARVIGSANVRFWPEARPDTLVHRLGHNAPIQLIELVAGEDGEPWYRVAETAVPRPLPAASYFVHSSNVRAPRTDNHLLPANPDRMPAQWFEADLKEPTLLTAYEKYRPVWSSMALYGKIGESTPLGEHKILWRVARETMTSERTYPPRPRTAPGGYYLENVLWTQYFDRTGAAIHYNYWASNWGYRASRGCLGLPLAESKWAWDWAALGTPIHVFI